MHSTDETFSRTDLLGIALWRETFANALATCRRRIAERAGGYACFVNVHTLTVSTSDTRLGDALREATFCFPDGVPLLWLSTLRGERIAERVCGPDFMDALLRDEPGRIHGFIGGHAGRGAQLAAHYGVDHVSYSPPMRAFSEEHAREDWEHFLTRCDGRPPALVWVGLGAPKQELWMRTVQRIAPDVMFFGVGAAFDFLTGAVPRAPRWLQPTGFEWAFRLSSDPKRLWKRYLTTNARFAVLCARDLLGSRRR